MVWCPGHKGVLINELADRAARAAEPYNILQGTSAEDLIRNQKDERLKYMTSTWNSYYKNSQFPHIDPTRSWIKNCHLERKGQTLIQNFRANTLFTNSLRFKIGLSDSPNCILCGTVETIDYIMFTCPSYNVPREKLRNDLTSLNAQPNLKDIFLHFSPALIRPIFEFLDAVPRFP